MSSPASTSNTFFEDHGHIIFPVLGTLGGLVLLLAGWALWRGPYRRLMPCCARRQQDYTPDVDTRRKRGDVHGLYSSRSAFQADTSERDVGMKSMAGSGAHGLRVWGRVADGDHVEGSLSSPTKIQNPFLGSRLQAAGLQGRPRRTHSFERPHAQSRQHASPRYRVPTSPGDAVGLAMLGGIVSPDHKEDYSSYHRSLSNSSRSSVAVSSTIGSMTDRAAPQPESSTTHLPYHQPANRAQPYLSSRDCPSDATYFALPVPTSSALNTETTAHAGLGNPFPAPTEPSVGPEPVLQVPARQWHAVYPIASTGAGASHDHSPTAPESCHRTATAVPPSRIRHDAPFSDHHAPSKQAVHTGVDAVHRADPGHLESAISPRPPNLRAVRRDSATSAVDTDTDGQALHTHKVKAAEADDMDVQMW